MEENNRREEYGEVKMTSPFLTRLENFWYHYKWHTLVTLFVLIVAIVLGVQMCARESYDIYIMYAGDKLVGKVQPEDGTLPEYNEMLSSLKRVTEDFDGNGETDISYSTLYISSLSDSENAALSTSDRSTLYERMWYGDYYLCFLSEEAYEDCLDHYKTSIQKGAILFSSLEGYVPEDSGIRYVNEQTKDAVYLSSTAFYELPGICELPADTVICLRTKTVASGIQGNSEEQFARSEEVLREIFSYGK